MTPVEAGLLLAVAASFDQRTVGEADKLAWHAALGDLPFDDARAAIVAHYREQTRRVMPADVRAGVRTIRNARAAQRPALEGGRSPMPDYFRSTVAEFRRRNRRGEGTTGRAPRLGDHYSTALVTPDEPDHAQRAAHDLPDEPTA